MAHWWAVVQFEWVTELGQKYVRIQLSKHLITTVWEHIELAVARFSLNIGI